jgi:hypothetical protein
MSKTSGYEGRNANIGTVTPGGRDAVARERQFRHIEFLIAEGAEEHLFRLQRQKIHAASFNRHPAIAERPGAIVISASNGQRHQIIHNFLFCDCFVDHWIKIGVRC